jgi:hypothetical protein
LFGWFKNKKDKEALNPYRYYLNQIRIEGKLEEAKDDVELLVDFSLNQVKIAADVWLGGQGFQVQATRAELAAILLTIIQLAAVSCFKLELSEEDVEKVHSNILLSFLKFCGQNPNFDENNFVDDALVTLRDAMIKKYSIEEINKMSDAVFELTVLDQASHHDDRCGPASTLGFMKKCHELAVPSLFTES